MHENLEIGAYAAQPAAAQLDAAVERMFRMFPVLREKSQAEGNALSGGQQQMLAIARALMSGPRFLLLDEPSLGLAPQMVRAVPDTILKVRQEMKTSVLLVEQNAGLALAVADRLYLMARGEIVAEGTPAELADSEALRAVYLGPAETETS